MSTVDNAPPETAAVAPRPAAPPAPAAAPGRMEPLNLARRPFRNSRPVVRVSMILWLLGLALLLGNVSLFRGYLTSSADKRQQIDRGEEEIDRQRDVTRQVQGRLDSIDLESLNQKVDFLNQKIAERTFSWNLLLDRLAAVLPNDVRLTRLAPQTGEQAKRELERRTRETRSLRPGEENEILLMITGESRSDGAHFRFVDNLFDHPAFREPNLTREERSEGNVVKFELNVRYNPGGGPQPVVEEEAPVVEEAPPGSIPGATAPAVPSPRAPRPPGGRP
ncbi:MAG TPA: PilN domain-containing protein [Thermoanaerobaculia bacterium]|jgi:hypothetical protein